MAQSRLTNHLKRKAVQNIFFVLIGFVVIVIVAVVFGTKLLVDYSLFIEKVHNNDTTSAATEQNDGFVSPPSLNSLPNATNNSQISVSGNAEKDQTVELYLNDQQVDKTSPDSDGHFNFFSITLHQGQNTLKARTVTSDNKKSDYSNTDTISYLKNPPSLTINQPQDGQGFDKGSSPSVSIQGQTDPGAKITVNDSWAIVDDQGNFNYLYTLKDGDNDIKVVATDDAGNKTTKEFHIHTN